jgi:hypothetical protein
MSPVRKRGHRDDRWESDHPPMEPVENQELHRLANPVPVLTAGNGSAAAPIRPAIPSKHFADVQRVKARTRLNQTVFHSTFGFEGAQWSTNQTSSSSHR